MRKAEDRQSRVHKGEWTCGSRDTCTSWCNQKTAIHCDQQRMRIANAPCLWQYLVCQILQLYQSGVCNMVSIVVLGLCKTDYLLRCPRALWLPQRHAKVLILSTYDVAFGNRVFANIISWNEVILDQGGPWVQWLVSLRAIGRHSHPERRLPCENEDRDWSIYKPRDAEGCWQPAEARRGAWNRFSLRTYRRNQSWWRCDFRLLLENGILLFQPPNLWKYNNHRKWIQASHL